MGTEEKTIPVPIDMVWSEHDKAILSGVKYYLEGNTYYWYENCFHYRNRSSMPDGLTSQTRTVWAMVCNPIREKHIFENGIKAINSNEVV